MTKFDKITSAMNTLLEECSPDFFSIVLGDAENYPISVTIADETDTQPEGVQPGEVLYEVGNGPPGYRESKESFTSFIKACQKAREMQTQMKVNWVGNAYENAACPDCEKEIPSNAVEGNACEECGHVFHHCRPVDDV
jgi:hypothetical protein